MGLVLAAPVAAMVMPSGAQTMPALGVVATPTPTPSYAKVVIIVGATEGTTSTYRAYADSEYAEAIKYTPNVIRLYSPDATWAAVQAAVVGANIVIYHGHGNGWPSPYPYEANYGTKDGFGLNANAGAGDNNRVYYGEPYVSALQLAPNAIVMLHQLCYAAGSSEPGNAEPTVGVAQQRADNYAAGFLRAGARAVLVDGHATAVTYLRQLFTTSQSLISLWRTNPAFHNHETSFLSVRTPGATVAMDSEQVDSGFYRAISGDLSTLTTDILTVPAPIADPTKGATFVPVPPTRVLDTRFSTGLAGRFIDSQPRTFQVAGVAGVPIGALAVTGNLTVTGQQTGGYVALGPRPSMDPTTSTINFPANDTRANGVVVALGSGGTLSATFKGYKGLGTHLLFDVTGYFLPGTSGATYVPVTPNRLLDSRFGNGFSGSIGVGAARSFQVTNRTPGNAAVNVPDAAIAVTGNLTVTGATQGGWLSLTPTLDSNPSTSTLNFPVGDDRANGVTVPLGSGGILSVAYNGPSAGATANVLFDVTGYFLPGMTGATYVSVDPNRLLDSRFANGFDGPLGVGAARRFQVTERHPGVGGLDVPAIAVAVTGNLTVTGQTGGGWLSLTPAIDNNPPTSTLNFPVADDRANGVAVPLGTGGILSVAFNGPAAGNATSAIFDVTGYFLKAVAP